MTIASRNLRHRTPGGIRYNRMNGFPTFNTSWASVSATDQIIISAYDLKALYREVFPVPVKGEDEKGDDEWTIELPASMNGAANLRAVNMSFVPQSGTLPGDPLGSDLDPRGLLGLNAAAHATTYDDRYIVTIDFQIRDDDFYEHEMTAAGQFMATTAENTNINDADANGQTRTGDAAADIDRKVNADKIMPVLIPRPTIEHTLSWPVILNPNFALMDSKLGLVNSDRPDLFEKNNDTEVEEEKGPAPGTLMFMGYSASKIRIWSPDDDSPLIPWKLSFHFSQMQTNDNGRIYGWNHVWSPKDSKWMALTRGRDLDSEPFHDSFDVQAHFKNFPGVS